MQYINWRLHLAFFVDFNSFELIGKTESCEWFQLYMHIMVVFILRHILLPSSQGSSLSLLISIDSTNLSTLLCRSNLKALLMASVTTSHLAFLYRVVTVLRRSNKCDPSSAAELSGPATWNSFSDLLQMCFYMQHRLSRHYNSYQLSPLVCLTANIVCGVFLAHCKLGC